MKFLYKLKKSLAKDLQTLKRLTFRQKITFLVDYYKKEFFALLCIGMIIFYAHDFWVTNQKEIVLQGFFTNDNENRFPSKQLVEEVTRLLQLEEDQRVILDDSFYIQPGSSDDYQVSSQSKVFAYISARELDFLVTTRELTEYYCGNVPLCDLEQLLPAQLAERLQDQFYYTEDGSGHRKACAVSMAGSRYYRDFQGDPQDAHHIFVFSYSKSLSQVIQFLEYAFEEP